MRFDAVTSLLYVDRRGAPENRQAGSTRWTRRRSCARSSRPRATAIASRGSPRSTGRCTKDRTRPPAVTCGERGGAGELPRALLPPDARLAAWSSASTGGSWWRAGTASPIATNSGLRRRPSWRALAFLARTLAGSRCARSRWRRRRRCAFTPSSAPDGTSWLVAWSADDTAAEWRPPRPVRRLFDRDGRELRGAGRGRDPGRRLAGLRRDG